MSPERERDGELAAVDRELADRLSAERPVPAGGFRGELGRHLTARDPGYGPRPQRLRLIVAAYLVPGLVLILLGALLAGGTL